MLRYRRNLRSHNVTAPRTLASLRGLAAFVALVPLTLTIVLPGAASAELLKSDDFRLDPNVGGAFGGSSGSDSYKMQDIGGEAAVGAGASQSFKLGYGYVRSLPQSIQLTVLPNGTYAYWPFNTGAGTSAYDLSANADDASLVAAPAWDAGIMGQGVTLNGSSQYVSTSKQVAGPGAFTIETWFKSTTNGGPGGYLMGFGDTAQGASGTLDRLIYLRDDGKITLGVKPSSSYLTVTTQDSYNDGSWHHVTGSLGPAGLMLYIDGIKRGSDSGITTAGSYSGYWRLGYDDLAAWPSAPASNYLAATVDEARVITRQLRDGEVAGDYSAGFNGLDNAFTLPDVTPGASQTYDVDAIVRTSAGGYDLYMQMPDRLTHTDGYTTIPDVSGDITTPGSWTEGTTKGFGFTLTSGYDIPGKWGTGPNFNYALIPTGQENFYSRPGFQGGVSGGAPDVTAIQYRADTAPSQKQGTYSANVIYTATLKP